MPKLKDKAPIQMPQKLTEVIAWLDSALKLRVAIDAQVDQSASEITEAELAVQAAAAAFDQAEIALALADTEAVSLEREEAAAKVRTALDTAQLALERKRRVREALCRRAVEIDDEVSEAKSMLSVEKSIFVNELTAQFHSELEQALPQLIATLRKFAALNSVLQSRGIFDAVSDVVIPCPGDATGHYPLVGATGAQINPSNWQDDPVAAEGVQVLTPLIELNRRLASFTPFVHPDKRPRPYVRRGYTKQGLKNDESPRGTWTQQDAKPGSDSRPSRTGQPQEMNPAARALDRL